MEKIKRLQRALALLNLQKLAGQSPERIVILERDVLLAAVDAGPSLECFTGAMKLGYPVQAVQRDIGTAARGIALADYGQRRLEVVS